MRQVDLTQNQFVQAMKDLRSLRTQARVLGLSDSAFTQAVRDFSPDIRRQVVHGHTILTNLRLYQEGE